MKFIKVFLAGLLAFVVGSFLFFFLLIFMLAGIAGSMEERTVVQKGSVLKINLAETITDAPVTDPLAGIDFMSMSSTPQLSLYEALRAIDAAAEDDRIDGIYIRLTGGGTIGSASMEELRAAIEGFKESGKFVIAYNETFSQGSYYLASVADKIYMEPEGGMEWTGLS
ncbi:MAG: S49 family peptidase, partial [Alistipes sp.]|nr:S49 family peptidase [Alistipes sp.]